jgi:hypothetical protein
MDSFKKDLESLSRINSSIYRILEQTIKDKLNYLYPDLKEKDEVATFKISRERQPTISVILHDGNVVDVKICEITFDGEDYQFTGIQVYDTEIGVREYDSLSSDEDFGKEIGFDNLYDIAETLI